jgi:biopolymer transport protein ExbD
MKRLPKNKMVGVVMRHLNQMLQDQDEKEEIDMTPMLDVVFILLIFFIVTASFVKEAGIDVNRPEAATAVKKERANILVAISDKGDIWINKRKVDVRSVQANIERLKAENPQGTVVIQADKKSTTDTLIKVMDSARAAGVYDVSIAAQES